MKKKLLIVLILLLTVSCVGNKTEKIYEEELMNLKINGYNDSKQLSKSDIKEIKKMLKKNFKNLGVTAVTKDGRFFISKYVTNPKNKEQTAKEVAIERPDIIDTIGEWCKSKGIKFKVIFVAFFDKEQDKRISQSMHHSHILEIEYEDKDYKKALQEGFSKYARATRF